MTKINIDEIFTQLNESFMETYKRGDFTGMGELYTEDGQILPPNGKVVTGKNDIAEYWKGAMEMGIKSVQLHLGEVEVIQDTAIEVSQATLLDEDKHVIDEIKYIVIWKRQGGKWKMHRDIINSNRVIPQ